jgi:uncharacterized protein YdeI (BOF family)
MRLFTAVLVAAGVLAAPAAMAAVVPGQGTYMGTDAKQRTVRFSHSGNQVLRFSVNHNVIVGNAHVSHNRFSTSQNGTHITGEWTDANHVEGTITAHHSTIHYEAHRFSS